MSPLEPYRKVLLVLIRQAPTARVLEAAHGLCERLGAGLEIVRLGHCPSGDQFGADNLIERPDWRAKEVVAWANSRACVAAVVLAAAELEADDAGEPGQDPWEHLACPLVVAGGKTD